MSSNDKAARRAAEREKWDAAYSGEVPPETAALNAFNEEFAEVVRELLPSHGSILEVGCGSGYQSLHLSRTGRYDIHLMDFSGNALAAARGIFEKAGQRATFSLGDGFERGTPAHDLVFNAGVLEHYDLDEQARFIAGMASRSHDLVLVLVPNRLCYWYWIWRVQHAAGGTWPWGREVPATDLSAAFEKAGVSFLGHALLGTHWAEEFVTTLDGIDESLREQIQAVHRSGLIPQAQRAYLLAALGSVRPQRGGALPPRWLTRVETASLAPDALFANLGDALALSIARRGAASAETVALAPATLTPLFNRIDEVRHAVALETSAMTQRISDLGAGIQPLANVVIDREHRLEQMDRELDAAQNALRRAEADSAAQRGQSHAQRLQLERFRSELTAAQQSLAQARQQNADLAQQLADAQAALATGQHSVDSAKERAAAAEHAQAQSRDQLQAFAVRVTELEQALGEVRTIAGGASQTLEDFKMHRSFRVARGMQIVRNELLKGSLPQKLDFVKRGLQRITGRKGPLSRFNALDIPIRQAQQIVSTVARALQSAPAAAKPQPLQPLGMRPGVVNIVTYLFLDQHGHQTMGGGAERYLIELAAVIRDMGYKPEIYQCGRTRWSREFEGISVHGLDCAGGIHELNRTFHTEVPPGELTIYSSFHAAQPYFHANSLGISHGVFWDQQAFQTAEMLASVRAAMGNCRRIVSVDTNTMNWVRGNYAELGERFVHIPNFVDSDVFRPSASRDSERVVVLYPRRLYAPRGFWLVAEVVPSLLEAYPQLEFHFVGQAEAKETSAVRSLQAKFGDRVRWEFIEPGKMPLAYQQADITLVPTLASEGTSLSCLEAMASGNAIITTNVGGLPELVIDGFNALMISPTAGELHSALDRLISDSTFRAELQKNARVTAGSFSIEKWCDRWRRVLRESLGVSAGTASAGTPEFVHLWAGGVTWGRMKQRPQQLFGALAEAGCRATFVCDEFGDRDERLIDGRLRLVARGSPLRIHNPILYIYFSYNYLQIADFEDPFVIYDILDDPRIHEENDRGNPPDANYMAYHRRLLQRADIVMTSSRRLQQQFAAERPDILLVPNGVKPEDFRDASPAPRPADLPPVGQTIVGYYGAVAEWFDFELLAKAAAAHPNWSFVLIGLTNRQERIDRLVATHPNVRYLGEKPYESLKHYLSAFDVAIIPFVVNEITNAVSPVKLFEYLAGGKPVVSTGFSEIRAYSDAILIGEDHEDFVRKLSVALSPEHDEMASAAAHAVVESNTWRQRAQVILSAVQSRRQPAATELQAQPQRASSSAPQTLAAAVAGETSPVFLFPRPSVPWGYMFQRPQQMARSLRKLGYPVAYAVDPSFDYLPDSNVKPILTLPDGTILFAEDDSAGAVRGVGAELICWQYWPHQAKYVSRLARSVRRIYDCVDDLSCFSQYPGIRQDHEEAMRSADLVLATSDDLLRRISKQRKDVLQVPNGAWYDDFAHPQSVDWPELDELRAQYSVIVGYYGALAEWIDWNLLDALVARRRDWAFVFVGELVGHDAVRSDERGRALANGANVRLWPRQPYERLGYLLSKFDVAIVPFVLNDLTHAVSPIKLFEYMAGGKPVISTPLRECKKYSAIRFASNADEFIAAVEWSISAGRSPEHRAALQACGAKHSWLARAEAVVAELKNRGILPATTTATSVISPAERLVEAVS